MSQVYTDPSRESDRWSLPDAETFYVSAREARDYRKEDPDTSYTGPGWYVWACFPGCMPDSDPFGPYATEAEAVAEWRDMYGTDDESL